MALSITKHVDESWRDCVIRYARRRDMETEAVAAFDAKARMGEERAALLACKTWNLCDEDETRAPAETRH